MSLENPGFETLWENGGTHRCIIFQEDGSHYEADVGNIFTPPGWVTWFKNTDTFAQPEVTDAWVYHDSRRVHSGEKATKLFTFSKRHDAGLLQQVQVEPGKLVTFTAWAHAWSNHRDKSLPDDYPHPDDPRWSEGSLVGYGAISLTPALIPPLNDDPQNDANGNVGFTVGIDPTGGVNPYSPDVVWGDVRHIYNGYHKLPAAEAIAQSETVTVFLRSITLWPFKHNDAYWDDAELTVSDPPEPPPSGECPGQPRIQYQRVSVLLPPDATLEEAFRVLRITHGVKFTVGYSADDAGMGNLYNSPAGAESEMPAKTVIALYPERWPDDLRAFFREHYSDPPVKYYPVSGNDFQVNGRLLAHVWLARNLGRKLLYPTSHQPPRTTDEFGTWRGYGYHNGLDIAAQPPDTVHAMAAGRVVVAGVNPDERFYGTQVRVESITALGDKYLHRYAHFVEGSEAVQVGDFVEAGDILGIADSTGDSTGHHLHIDIKFQGQYIAPGVAIDWHSSPVEPPPPPPQPITASTIGLHVQSPSADGDGFGDVQFVEMVQPSVMKLVGNMEKAREYKAVSPDTKVVYRQWTPWQDYYKEPDLERAAWDFLRTFLDSLLANAEYIDYAEGLNEVGLQCGFVDPRFIEFERQFAIALDNATGGEVAAALGGIAVGNPQHPPAPDFGQMLPMIEAICEYGGALNYHGYVLCKYGVVDWDAEYHYSLRALLSMDPYFTSRGLYPRYIHGETGAFVNATDGWRKSNCLNGDKAAYAELLKELDRRCKATPAGLQGRFVGNTIFTANAGRDDWRYYDVHPDYRYFAEALVL